MTWAPGLAADPAIEQATHACVAGATGPGALAACEVQARSAWEALLDQRRNALLARLPNGSRAEFAAAQTAWEAFRDREFRLIDATFAQRTDGLGAPLAAGAKTELLRQRVHQLTVHLSNLPATGVR